MVNTSIGEVLVRTAKGEVKLRPSFLAMSKVGDPKEIVAVYKALSNGLLTRDNLARAQHVIQCCASTECDWLTGWIQPGAADDRLKVRIGKMPPQDLLIMAAHLLKWGIAGDPHVKGSGEPMAKFDASELVGAAVRHFGVQPDAAWHLTMTEFQRIVEAGMEQKAPDTDKHRAFMDHADSVSRALDKQRMVN